MTEPGFEATWYPRLGKDAAEEFRRMRRLVWLVPLMLVFSMSAGVLIGTGSLGNAIGGVCLPAALISFWVWLDAQWRTAAVAAVWFGVKRFWWMPRMTPQRFDEWPKLNGFMTPDERRSADS
jgi:hypothetical protein